MAELQPPEGQTNGGTLVVASVDMVGTKRHRRPSVRLGDIGGDQAYESQPHGNRRTKQWKLQTKDAGGGGGQKFSKTRPLTNLTSSGEYHETLDGEDKEVNLDGVAIGSWKVRNSKLKGGSVVKKKRSNWIPKVNNDSADGNNDGNENLSGGEDVDDAFREFDDNEDSGSPVHDMAVDTDNDRDVHCYRRGTNVNARVSEDTDARNWNNNNCNYDDNNNDSERNGVRVWLNQLGLERYAPVFEIHEVDDEVLPMLTLEDLKDMGINAVGSRRKMYCSIQKLGKGFS